MNYWQSLVFGVAAVMVTTAAAADVSRLTLKVEGMTQTGCSSPPAIRGTTMNFPGVREANVSLELGEMTLEYETGQLDLEKLIAMVERACQVRITRPPAR